MSIVIGGHVGLPGAESVHVCERVRTGLVRTEKGCTGEVRASRAWEEKRAEAQIAQGMVQIPLMESSDLHVWRLKTGVVEPEEEAVDLQEIDVDQALLALELSYSRTLNSTGRMRRRNVQRFLCRPREAA